MFIIFYSPPVTFEDINVVAYNGLTRSS